MENAKIHFKPFIMKFYSTQISPDSCNMHRKQSSSITKPSSLHHTGHRADMGRLASQCTSPSHIGLRDVLPPNTHSLHAFYNTIVSFHAMACFQIIWISVIYPERHSKKTFIGEQ